VLRVDAKDRKIGLSRKNLHGGVPDEIAEETPPPEAPEAVDAKAEKSEKPRELRGGTGSAGPLFSLPGQEEKK
jgi:small subunit ribosomal protein S1